MPKKFVGRDAVRGVLHVTSTLVLILTWSELMTAAGSFLDSLPSIISHSLSTSNLGEMEARLGIQNGHTVTVIISYFYQIY